MTTRDPCPHSAKLDHANLVGLDQRVGQQLLAHPLELGTGPLRVGRVNVELDEAPDPRPADREAEVAERALDRRALRVEDALPWA